MEPDLAEVAQQYRRRWLRNGDERDGTGRVQFGQVVPTETEDSKLKTQHGFGGRNNHSTRMEEHEHFGIFPVLEGSLNDTFGDEYETDDLMLDVKNDIGDEAPNKLSSVEQDNMGLKSWKAWRKERRGWTFDNGNKDQNNNDENDDYEYKIANQASSEGGGAAAAAEIDDRSIQSGSGESTLSSAGLEKWRKVNSSESRHDKDLSEKKTTLGRLKRKLLSIEGESADAAVADDRDDTVSDYDDDKRRGVGPVRGFKGGKGSYRNEDGDDLGRVGEPNQHFYHQSVVDGDDPYDDVSDLGSFVADASNQYATALEDTPNWNKGNNERRSAQEMNRRVDSVNGDKVTFRRRKSANPSDDTLDKRASVEQEAIPDRGTVYHQHYEDSNDSAGGGETNTCDCALKCAQAKQEAENATESSTDDSELTTAEIDEESTMTEEPEEEPEPGTQRETEQQREVYIDLKIGVKTVGNASLSGEEGEQEPIEYHRKFLVKRGQPDSELSPKTGTASSATQFPIDLVKAIYQLVDRNDSLRVHVAPRLPDRAKLLSKLEQTTRRSSQKINDRGSSLVSGGGAGGPGAVNRIEDDRTNSKTLAAVIEAIGELIRQRPAA